MIKVLFIVATSLWTIQSYCMEATKRIEAVEKNTEGTSFQGTAVMTVKRGSEERNLKMKIWWKERKYAFLRILEPKKDSGTASLRINTDLWQYLPKINRIIRVPSSMMLQSWMGSDFTNDDLVKGGSLLNDYTHKELLKEKILGHDTVKIECTPKSSAAVVWGKIHLWVREIDNTPVKHEFYTEKGVLVKVLVGDSFQKFGNHTIPTKLLMQNLKKKDSETIISYDPGTIKFDADISNSVFTQENLRRP